MRLKFLFAFLVSILVFGSVIAQEIPANISSGKGYMLWPGDEVTGKVLGEPEFDFVTTVNEDGNIEVPFFDKPVPAKCRTESDLRTEVSKLLRKYLKTPQLSLRVTDRKSRPPATISGEVNAPQQVILFRKVRLIELLSVAGGIKEEAGGSVQVFRTQPPLCSDDSEEGNWKNSTSDPTEVPSRIYFLRDIKLAKDESNPIIYPGDVILVQKASPVYVTGQVVAPQGIYIKEGGLSLSEAIAKVSGVREEAKTRNIKVYRLKPDSKDREILTANYDLIRKGQQKDILLQPFDIVEVDKAKDSLAVAILKIAVGAGKTAISSVTNSIGYKVLY
ncbi:MAG: polysaccharide biosynthesis/export family protein [Pyrinomonadaceae bacterium]